MRQLILTVAIIALTSPAFAQQITTVPNHGGAMEGHTPRGFRGMGTGLFVGDNLNPSFPQGDGVQTFLTFDLTNLPAGEISQAVLSAPSMQVSGTPFRDLGPLTVEAVAYERFSPDLWNTPATGPACTLATAPADTAACDVTTVVRDAQAAGSDTLQFRLRLEQAGDSDGQPDMVIFFATNPNQNQPGLFALQITTP